MKKKIWITVSVLIVALLSVGTLRYKNTSNNIETVKEREETETHLANSDDEIVDSETEKKGNKKLTTSLTDLNEIILSSQSTDEIYITDILEVGEEEEVKPGIYDMEILGGGGNIFGERASVPMHINWLGGAKGSDYGYPSVIRVILFEGDELEFHEIGKVKFTAVPEKVTPGQELRIGEYIVGRDVPVGKYKLATNMELDEEFDNLGWQITSYDLDTEKSKQQSLTANNPDVALNLKEGQIISIFYDNTDFESDGDAPRLILKEM